MPVSAATYERIALEDPEGQWELVGCGHLRRKPGMSSEHNSDQRHLGFFLQTQLGFDEYEVAQNSTRLAVYGGRYFVPDICVIPRARVRPRGSRPEGLETYVEPLPLIIEVWSPSTGDYDVDEKLPQYQERGDLEIWRVHPYERTIVTWVREPDGSYTRAEYRDGEVRPRYLPGVVIELARLFV